ncbi:MAG TPA: DUF1326 domain-containing protein [Planctomycetota bacterium]|jgi:hypothetical protein
MKKILGVFAILSIAAGCASTGRPAPKPEAPPAPGEVSFEFHGSRIIGCCCPSPCPCRLNKKPYHCHGCDHTDAVRIDSGHLGKVRMDGFTYVFIGRGFGEDTSKNWVYCYVTDKATDEQMQAFQAMLDDMVKSMGPKAPHLAGKFVGLRKVPITYTVSADKTEYGVTIPGILEFKTRAIFNPGHKTPVVSTGIMDAFGDRFVHADCLVHKYKDAEINYEWDLTGRQSNQAEFVLNNAIMAKGGIGWGCWTSHVDFGDKGLYAEQWKDKDEK